MKKFNHLIYLALISMFVISSCEQLDEVIIDSSFELESRAEIQRLVEAEMAVGKVFHWNEQTNSTIFSAAMHSDSIISIGYTIDPEFDFKGQMHKIDISSSLWAQARAEIEEIIITYESRSRNVDVEMVDLEPFGKVSYFPQIQIEVTSFELIDVLRKHPNVRFVEPIGFNITDYSPAARSNSGCEGNPNYSINSADYTTITPTIKLPWNFQSHNIDDAWNVCNKGDNVKVCIIDTGGSFSQDNIGSKFNSGYSSGRTVEKYSTKYSGKWWWKTLDSPDDPCGHGTSMAGTAAAPRSNDGNSVGIAYQSNLMTIRGVEDVIISTSNERNGVRDALILAGNSNVKVISMSIGTPFYSSTVADGIYYAYNQQKMIIAAAGTSLPWTSWYPVIFPANMSQTVAVTGVKDSPYLDKCETCHSGSQVDFVIIMERQYDDERHSLSLARYSNQPKYIGGSSTATATVAGIATMVWAENTSASRTSVLNTLKGASSIYPARSSEFGWGLIDAFDAVSGL